MKTLIVTGATGDVGAALVPAALAQGYRVIATVRDQGYADRFTAHDNLTLVTMHVDKSESVAQAFDEIDQLTEGQGPLNIMHGAAVQISITGEFMPVDLLEHHLHVNTVGSFCVIREAIPRLRARGGKLVLASSLWGRTSGPMVSAYAASKHALEALADGARRETRHMNFQISLAEIGVIKGSHMVTGHLQILEDKQKEEGPSEEYEIYRDMFIKFGEMSKQAEKFAITPDKVASQLLGIINKDRIRARYRIGMDAKLICMLAKYLPDWLMDRVLT